MQGNVLFLTRHSPASSQSGRLEWLPALVFDRVSPLFPIWSLGMRLCIWGHVPTKMASCGKAAPKPPLLHCTYFESPGWVPQTWRRLSCPFRSQFPWRPKGEVLLWVQPLKTKLGPREKHILEIPLLGTVVPHCAFTLAASTSQI